ncbi:MAG: S8 family serine peptidase [Bacteroidales bacterium]|jgi:serine protease AprX|nr:S8 family serine peptidase [Bacteroidales bacterium]MDI9574836.1 S8 family serine peptidase [Bacteroidota bacterium]MDD2593309.1 S8 family serine peptidase [Bacteroidales bacterium]MDD3755459.1 S8 family serine peptidase [Bacteroidales bacterium]MDY0400788.1 S8 family serine peptidase [Bacteroidales bacterium]
MVRNRSIFLIILILLSGIKINSQIYYRVDFSNKFNTNYSLDQPELFLSNKAIERREKFNIPIDSTDLPVNSWYLDSLTSLDCEVLYTSRWFNSAVIKIQNDNIINRILQLPFVVNAQLVKPKINKETDETKITTPSIAYSDITKKSTKIPQTIYGFSTNQNQMIGIHILHQMGYKGDGIVIAVLDAGFSGCDHIPFFDSLRLKSRLLGTKDFVFPGNNVYNKSNHGTSVLALMASNIPNILVGTAPEASYWLIRTEDPSSEYLIEEENWIAGAEFADSVGVDIINSSLGYTTFNLNSQNHSYTDLDGKTTRVSKGAAMAASKGMIICNSAGNSGNSSWYYIGAPADADSIITVGAVDSLGIVVEFSSKGPTYDGRIKPTVCAQGANVFTASQDSSIIMGNGTSFSSPIIAGATACLLQKHPNSDPISIITSIIKSANRYLTPNNFYGYGIPNFAVADILANDTSISSPPWLESTPFIYPNPFTSYINIIYQSKEKSFLDIALYSINGTQVFKNIYQLFPGNNYIIIEQLDSLSSGIYIIAIGANKTIKVVKQ